VFDGARKWHRLRKGCPSSNALRRCFHCFGASLSTGSRIDPIFPEAVDGSGAILTDASEASGRNQDTTVSADLTLGLDVAGLTVKGDRAFAKSGSVDWVDPFIGARLRQVLAPGQNLTLRGDVGGFDVGSEFTWQVLATYDFQLCVTDRYTLDGYLGYRALSVDYSQGSGNNRYEFDVLMQGPVMGATLRF
jgi:hypothetical protein